MAERNEATAYDVEVVIVYRVTEYNATRAVWEALETANRANAQGALKAEVRSVRVLSNGERCRISND